MSTQPFNTVYGDGSSSATTGTVDPLGYITRELERRRKMYQGGADGQSDTRSGLAAGPLQNSPVGLPNGQQIDAGAQLPQQVAQVASSPTGALQFPGLDLPVDLDLTQQRTGYLGQYNQEVANNTTQLQQAAQQKLLQQNQLDQNIPLMFRNLINGFSGRGMAYSSGYGRGVVNTNRDILGAQNDIDTGYNNAAVGVNQANSSAQQAFLQRLGDIGIEQANRAAAKAGNLNLDPNYVDPAGQAAPAATPLLGYSGAAPAPKPAAKPAAAKAPTRADFLKDHPVLKSKLGNPAELRLFLKNHPDIAKAWARY